MVKSKCLQIKCIMLIQADPDYKRARNPARTERDSKPGSLGHAAYQLRHSVENIIQPLSNWIQVS